MHLFTSESVTVGHPDKVCDTLSDAIVDAYLAQDADARTAVEVRTGRHGVHVFGEVGSHAEVDIESIVRDRLVRIGYSNPKRGLDGTSCDVVVSLNPQ